MHGFRSENISALIGAYRQKKNNGFVVPFNKSVVSRMFSIWRFLFVFVVHIHGV